MLYVIKFQESDRAAILAALYNASYPLGVGWLCATPEPMTVTEAEVLLHEHKHFDYLKGRVMKVDLSTNILDPWLYDMDNGNKAALRALTVARIPITLLTE